MTGLVLEGGAIRTIFSSGVCDGLLHMNLMADYVVGVSAGIAYGVSYVSRQEGRNLKILEKYVNDPRYMGVGNFLDVKNRCYFGLKFTYDTIPNKLVPFDYISYGKFKGDVEAVVTNLLSGQAEYRRVPAQNNSDLLQATCAMPFLFPIYDLDGQPYLDGGAADAIPYQRAFDRGCDKAVVVLTRERSYRRKPEQLQPLLDRWYRKYPKFCDTMRRRADTYNESRERLFALEQEGKVFLLSPHNTAGFTRTEKDLHKIRALWKDGYDQALENEIALRAFMN
ncbi:MAG: patatin family protein [Oscillospiraceae bacterium]